MGERVPHIGGWFRVHTTFWKTFPLVSKMLPSSWCRNQALIRAIPLFYKSSSFIVLGNMLPWPADSMSISPLLYFTDCKISSWSEAMLCGILWQWMSKFCPCRDSAFGRSLVVRDDKYKSRERSVPVRSKHQPSLMEVVQSNQPAIRWLAILSLSPHPWKFCIYYFFWWQRLSKGDGCCFTSNSQNLLIPLAKFHLELHREGDHRKRTPSLTNTTS